MLVPMGEIKRWEDGKGDPESHVPADYYIDGMIVKFWPNWGQWEVGSFKFQKFPASQVEVLKVIAAVRLLMSLKASSL